MSTMTVPKSGDFAPCCMHCGAKIGRAGKIKTKPFELKTYDCGACHEITLVKDCETYQILNKVVS